MRGRNLILATRSPGRLGPVLGRDDSAPLVSASEAAHLILERTSEQRQNAGQLPTFAVNWERSAR
jgi:hypothetical protein